MLSVYGQNFYLLWNGILCICRVLIPVRIVSFLQALQKHNNLEILPAGRKCHFADAYDSHIIIHAYFHPYADLIWDKRKENFFPSAYNDPYAAGIYAWSK